MSKAKTVSDKHDGLFIFPYYVGPAVRPFSIGLVWSGRLIVTIPGWPSGKPPQIFLEIVQYSVKINHPLKKLFATAWHYYNLASKQGISELEKLAPLGDKLNRIFLLNPGERLHYDDWLPLHERCLPTVSKTLENQQILNSACTEFVWRVYALFLELDENPQKVLDYLNSRSSSLGYPDHYLLLESALHHYSIGKVQFPEIITDSIDVLAVFSEVGSSFSENQDNFDVRVAQLAYLLFQTLLEPYIPRLLPKNLESLLTVLNNKNDSINSAKKKCFTEANKLIVDKSNGKERIAETINNLKNEITEIVELDAQAWKSLLQSLSEDRVFWTSIAGLLGTMSGPMPSVVPAAAAITVLSSIGTTAMKERRLRRELLQKSPWSLVYYFRNKN